jgi:hypothetical protein
MNNNPKKQVTPAQKPKKAKSSKKANKGSTVSRISIPSAVVSATRGSNPILKQGRDFIRVEHREFLGTITASASFDITYWAIQPGLIDSFPWLALIAVQWEMYRVVSMQFRYITRSATSSKGSIIMAPDYDVLDEQPAAESVITTYRDVVEGPVYSDLLCKLDPRAMHSMGPKKFVRTYVPGGADLKTYDCGNFYLATVDCSDTPGDAIGKLWVEYVIEFFVPQTNLPIAPKGSQTTLFQGAAGTITFGPATTYVPLAVTLVDYLKIGNFGSGSDNPAFSDWVPPAGAYLIRLDGSVRLSADAATYSGDYHLIVNIDGVEVQDISLDWDYATSFGTITNSNSALGKMVIKPEAAGASNFKPFSIGWFIETAGSKHIRFIAYAEAETNSSAVLELSECVLVVTRL